MLFKSILVTSAVLMTLNASAGLGGDPNLVKGGASAGNPFAQTNLNGSSANNILPGLADLAATVALAGGVGGTSASSGSQAWLSPTGKQLNTNALVSDVYKAQGSDEISQ